MSFQKARPTHRIKARQISSATGELGKLQGDVGVAWLNPDQSISIQLNAGVVLRWDDALKLTAFPTTSAKDPTDG